ncbi:PfkB family carbohydrate kinase [Sporolactobacillus spathodeae]|uniref:Sugar/nucleoside kinase (Ribokinase family) n=1 Tax=Sporolactobacillus spathodeae TaxID=1465502 RepID=A0ABS2Q5P0_9BACL|nr:sugar/nucleoside kinase (ribokinase family) [Sporolactobacillus spathodeae]
MRFLGLGDNVVDIYESRQTMYPGGNALNFAVFARKLGFEAAFLGAFGTDKIAEYVRSSVKVYDVDLSHCRIYEGENGFARVTLKDGDRVFLGSNRGGVLSQYGLNISNKDVDYLKTFDLIHCNINGFSDDALPLIHQLGIPISYDFSSHFTEEDIKRVAKYIDIACFSCSHLTENALQNLASRILGYGCDCVLCTQGENGAFLFTEGQCHRQPAHYIKAQDTMGAGDAFLTCFLVHYYKNLGNAAGKKEAITNALELAADFSAQQCLVEGSFGMGKKINMEE